MSEIISIRSKRMPYSLRLLKIPEHARYVNRLPQIQWLGRLLGSKTIEARETRLLARVIGDNVEQMLFHTVGESPSGQYLKLRGSVGIMIGKGIPVIIGWTTLGDSPNLSIRIDEHAGNEGLGLQFKLNGEGNRQASGIVEWLSSDSCRPISSMLRDIDLASLRKLCDLTAACHHALVGISPPDPNAPIDGLPIAA